MKHSVWRPLLVVAAVVALILLVRVFYVPKDFGIGDRGFRFSWHRAGNENDWKAVTVKYQGRDYCSACHQENYDAIMKSPHAIIQCENCHGPAVRVDTKDWKTITQHPDTIDKLDIDRSRDLCLRCHNGKVNYPTSGREAVPTIDPDGHNAGTPCADCHNPHDPSLGGKK